MRNPKSNSIGIIALGVTAAAVLVAAIVALAALITMLAWNLGVVALVAATGNSVGTIGFVTAIFVNMAIGVVSRIFRSPSVTAKS